MAYSYTQISLFEKCPLAYKFRYVHRIKGEKSDALINGIKKHERCEKFLKKKQNSVSGIHKESMKYLRFLRDMQAGSEEFWHLNKDWEPVSEWSYMVVKADAFFIPEDDRLCVVDFKTGKQYPTHKDQLHLQATAGMATFECTMVESVAHYLDTGISLISRYLVEDFKTMCKTWDARAKPIAEAKGWPACPGYHCKWCEFGFKNGGICEHG